MTKQTQTAPDVETIRQLLRVSEDKWFRGEFCVKCGKTPTTVNQNQTCKKCLAEKTIEEKPTNKVSIEFSTQEYERSHGKMPRGFGQWAFQIADDKIMWVNGATLGAAKREIKARVAALPAAADFDVIEISILP